LRKNMTPLSPEEIPTFEEWLESTPYTQGRKTELRGVWERFLQSGDVRKFNVVKSFIKDETYIAFKNPRIINSRVDVAKCFFGPVVQAVSDKLFSLDWFIKTVPVPDRPVVIRDALLSVGAETDYVFTDYTAFEAHFVKTVMEVTQVELFKFMLGGAHISDDQKNWLDLYVATMTGRNHLIMKFVDIKLTAVRMSGEMDTSTSNGFANLMLFLFACHQRGARSVNGFVEGDDGLFRVIPSSAAPTKEDFADLGFTIKIEHTQNLSEASFCGQVYDMTDLIVVTDPVEAVLRLGWTNKKYVKANSTTLMYLLRAKGYSLVYQYKGCPILDELGRRILHLTEGVNIPEKIYANMDQWEAAKLRAAITAGIPDRVEPGKATRALVERLYGVTILKQLQIEEQFRKLELGYYPNPFDNTPSDWVEYYDTYSLDHFVVDPCWLLKAETGLRSALSRFDCCGRFLRSL
jgi:hypothetical protein